MAFYFIFGFAIFFSLIVVGYGLFFSIKIFLMKKNKPTIFYNTRLLWGSGLFLSVVILPVMSFFYVMFGLILNNIFTAKG